MHARTIGTHASLMCAYIIMLSRQREKKLTTCITLLINLHTCMHNRHVYVQSKHLLGLLCSQLHTD